MLACREWKYPPAGGYYTIIFRTIFFTWLPECIKKIACLLCGSVLARRSSSQRLSDYTIETLRKIRIAINVFNGKLGDTRSILIVVSVLEGKRCFCFGQENVLLSSKYVTSGFRRKVSIRYCASCDDRSTSVTPLNDGINGRWRNLHSCFHVKL